MAAKFVNIDRDTPLLLPPDLRDWVQKSLKRRVASIFPNEASLLHLVTGLLCEISNEWATSKIYLNMNLTDPPKT